MKKIYTSAVALLLALCVGGCSFYGDTNTDSGSGGPIPPAGSSTETTGMETTATTNTTATTETSSVMPTPTPEFPTDGYEVFDPNNTRGLSEEKISFGFGYASGGKPHEISINNQAYFDSLENMDILALDTKSEEKVLYLTFSCDYEYNGNTAKIVNILNEKDVDAAFFCSLSFYRKNPSLVKKMIRDGHILGNHTVKYPDVSVATRTELAEAIYELDSYVVDTYDYRPQYFSFSSGIYTESALDLVSGLGHNIVFWSLTYADWDTDNQMGSEAAFDLVTSRLHPGAVIMLHPVSDDNAAMLGDLIDYARANGYTFKTLDEYFGEYSSSSNGNQDDPNKSEGGELPEGGYTVYDPDNTRGLSEENVPFGFGYATGGQPHEISINNQAYFDSLKGVSALALDTVSSEKVLYLTFDCGYEYHNNSNRMMDILAEKDVDAAFFCTLSFLKNNTATAKRMIEDGHIVGNHSNTHPVFPDISRTEMAEELYAVDKYLMDTFGYDCNYFRFPTGAYSESALELVTGVGHSSVFWSIAYADWDTENQKSYEEAFETVTSRLHPGAVILLHAVSDTNVEILADFIDYARENGYVFKTLDDYFNQ